MQSIDNIGSNWSVASFSIAQDCSVSFYMQSFLFLVFHAKFFLYMQSFF